MKYYILAEIREKHENLLNNMPIYNDYVSEQSMKDLLDAFNKNGYECEFLGGIKELFNKFENNEEELKQSIVINYNYGFPSHYKRGQSPILLELLKANYSGSDPLTSLLVNDKTLAKKVLCGLVDSPKGILLKNRNEINTAHFESINFPVVAKPNCEGSSLGIDNKSFCKNLVELKEKVNELFNKYTQIIIEEYIPGFEVTVWIIGNKDDYELVQPLVISVDGQYYFKSKIFTAEDKANHIREYSLPERVFSNKLVQQLTNASKLIFEELNMRDYGRLDFRVYNDEIYFIEANALPIFSKSSEIGEISKLCKIEYNKICEMLRKSISKRLMTKTD